VLQDRDGEQNKPLVIQEEAVNDLLCHLDAYQSMGPDGIHLGVLGELAEKLDKPLSIIYQPSWLTGPRQLENCPCNTHLQEGPEGGSWELQACQAGSREDYGVIRPECAHWACEGQPGDEAQPA